MRIEHNKLLRLIAVFLVGLTALITAKQIAAEINAVVPWNETDPLVTLNDAFRAEYSRAKTEALSKVGPLIIVEGTNVVLVRNENRSTDTAADISIVKRRGAYPIRRFSDVRSVGF
jgi:hypothetical protein